MRPSDLYSAELLAALTVVPRHLPPLAPPIEGEALPAWLHRFAEPLELSPGVLMFDEIDAKQLANPSWWRQPPLALLERLAARSGAPLGTLQSMTFSAWNADPATDDVTGRFARGRVHQLGRRAIPTRRHGVCPRCIAGDEMPFVRKEWTLGWVAVCEKHSLVLNTSCSECRSVFILPPLRSPGYGWLMGERCRCGAVIADEPAIVAHPLAVRLQSALRTGRSADSFDWLGLGSLAWTTAVALIDLILGIAWIGSRPELRRLCFARIEYELGLTSRLSRHCYDGLLIAAWVLEQWPGRAASLSLELKVPAASGQLVLWDHLPPETSESLQCLVLSSPSSADN
jgi:TniQ